MIDDPVLAYSKLIIDAESAYAIGPHEVKMMFDGFDVTGDGVLTLKELVQAATRKMSTCKLSDEKIEAIMTTLAKTVPDLQNRETFAKSYAVILGELYISVQLEQAVTANKGGSRAAALEQSASRRFSVQSLPIPSGTTGHESNRVRASLSAFGRRADNIVPGVKLTSLLRPTGGSRLACMRVTGTTGSASPSNVPAVVESGSAASPASVGGGDSKGKGFWAKLSAREDGAGADGAGPSPGSPGVVVSDPTVVSGV